MALLAQLSCSRNSRPPTLALATPPTAEEEEEGEAEEGEGEGEGEGEEEEAFPSLPVLLPLPPLTFQTDPYVHAHLSAFSLPSPSNQAESSGSVAASVTSWAMIEA